MTATSASRLSSTVNLVPRILLALALGLLAIASSKPLLLPRSVSASPPPDAFSPERAMAHLAEVSRAPHGAGSEEQARVRDYILETATTLGLQTTVDKDGVVENVLASLPGTASTRDVLITGHYDSHPPSPGAGDDGISVAAMLETMRALQAGPPLANDIVFLFTDGEELGWLGAQSFVRTHPDARDETGVLLCFDGRPGNGPLSLSSTSPGDAWLIRQLASASPPLYADSWRIAEERSDSDTDCTSVFIPAGFIGFEFENQSRGPRYHMATDTADAISPQIVQAFGVSMVRLARHFGNLDLTDARLTHDDAYFTLPFVGIVIYPTWPTPATAVAGMVAFVLLAAAARRIGQLSLTRTALATVGFLAGLLLITFLASLVWNQVLASADVTYDLGTDDPYFEGISSWMAGIMAAGFVLGLAVLYGLSRRIGAVSLSVGGLLVFLGVWWAAYFFLNSANPLTNPPLAWSLLAGVASLAVLMSEPHRAWTPALLFLAAVPIFVLIVPAVLPQIVQPEDDGAWVPILIMGLALGVLAPQIAFVMGLRTDPGRGDSVPHAPLAA